MCERKRKGSQGGSRKRLLWNPTSNLKIPKVSKPKHTVNPQPGREAIRAPKLGSVAAWLLRASRSLCGPGHRPFHQRVPWHSSFSDTSGKPRQGTLFLQEPSLWLACYRLLSSCPWGTSLCLEYNPIPHRRPPISYHIWASGPSADPPLHAG